MAERVVWKKYGIEDKIAYSLRKNEAVTELVEALEFFHVIVLASLSEALDEDDFYTDLLGVLGYTRHPTHDTHSTKRPSPHRNMIR